MLPLAIPTAFLGDEALTQGSQGPLRYKLLIQRSIRLAFHTIVRQKKIFGIVSECHTHQLFSICEIFTFFQRRQDTLQQTQNRRCPRRWGGGGV